MRSYLVGTVQGQAFHNLFKPEEFEAGDKSEASLAETKAKGRQMVEKGFSIVGGQLNNGLGWLVASSTSATQRCSAQRVELLGGKLSCRPTSLRVSSG